MISTKPILKEVKIPKPDFLTKYRSANFLSKIFFHYFNHLIASVNANGGVMTEAMIEDMTEQDGETDRQTERF
jgi:hypothetical protein